MRVVKALVTQIANFHCIVMAIFIASNPTQPLVTSFNDTLSLRLNVGPDDATLLFGTRDSVPMEHCSTLSLSQGVASASNNVDSWDCESWGTFELSDIVGSSCNTLGQRGTMLHGETVPCPKEQSCIV